MIEIQDNDSAAKRNDGSSLAKLNSGSISTNASIVSVGQLEMRLLSRFPRCDAEEWDRMGLLVGDPAATVKGVMVALDPTSRAIDAAAAKGANVLLTHHPVFLEAPAVFSPSYEVAEAPGVNVYEAIKKDVALINLHTALDVSREAASVLPSLLSLEPESILVPSGDDPSKGYGQLCRVRKADAPFTLARLSARCTSVFGRVPRVWGDSTNELSSIVIANGSAGNVVRSCIETHVDCLVCGEIRYHSALDASQTGLSIVELGHDVSELPLTAVLARAATESGIPACNVSIFDQSGNWTTPESTRI